MKAMLKEAQKKMASAGQSKQLRYKMSNLRGVNVHFEPGFNVT